MAPNISNSETPPPPRFLAGLAADLPRGSHLVWALLLLGASIFNNALWLKADNLNPLWDEASYLSRSLETYELLRSPSHLTLEETYFQRLGVRPTFFFVGLATPFYALFGTQGDVAILGVNSLYLAVLLFSTYALGHLLFSRRIALLGMLVTASAPHVGVLARIFWPHFGVVAIAALGTYAIFKTDRLRRLDYALFYGAVLGYGLLMRSVYPAIFLFGPTACVCLLALFYGAGAPDRQQPLKALLWRNFKQRIWRRMVPALVVTLALAGAFYVSVLGTTLRFAQQIQTTYSERWAHRQTITWYVENVHRDASWFLVAAIVIGLAVGLLKRRRPVLLLATCCAISTLVLSLQAVKNFYYFVPTYPFLALIAVSWLEDLDRRRLRQGLSAVLVFGCLLIGWRAAWSPSWWPSKRLDPVFAGITAPPDSRDWHAHQVARTIFRAHGQSTEKPRVGFISNSKILAPAPFEYLTRPHHQRLVFEAPLNVIRTLLQTDFLVVMLQGRSAHGLGRRALMYELPWGAGHPAFNQQFRQIASFPLAPNLPLEVYQRRRQPTPTEARQIVEPLIAQNPEQTARLLCQEIPALRYGAKIRGALTVSLGDALQATDQPATATLAYGKALALDPSLAEEIGKTLAAQPTSPKNPGEIPWRDLCPS